MRFELQKDVLVKRPYTKMLRREEEEDQATILAQLKKTRILTKEKKKFDGLKITNSKLKKPPIEKTICALSVSREGQVLRGAPDVLPHMRNNEHSKR